MSDTEELERDLAALAGRVDPGQDVVGGIVRRGRRLRARRRAAAALSAVAAVALVGGVSVAATQFHHDGASTAGRGGLPAVAGDGPFLGWPVAGTAARNSAMVSSAVRVWDQHAGAAHSNVHPLAVQTTSDLGPVVILEAYDAHGHARLAVLTGTSASSGTSTGALRVRVDSPAPATDTAVIGTVSSRWGAATGQSSAGDAEAIVLAQPGVTATDVTSTSVDASFGDSRATGRFDIQPLPPQASTLTTTAVLYAGKHAAITGAALNLVAVGDPQPVPAQIIGQKDGTIELATSSARIRVGDLVAEKNGLIGRVVARSATGATVQPVTAQGFRMPAHTSISNIGGELTGTGHSVVFTQNQPGDVNQGNRIEAAVPGMNSPSTGAITVGFAGTGIHFNSATAASNTTALHRTAPVQHGHTVYVLTAP